MNLTLKDLIVDVNHFTPSELIEDWIWLIGDKMKPILVSVIGEMFLEDEAGKVHWLNVGVGELELAAKSRSKFFSMLEEEEILDNWFMRKLVKKILGTGMALKPNELFGFKILPLLSGTYEVDNFEPTNISIHFSLAGQTHEQVKDLPDGTIINEFKFK